MNLEHINPFDLVPNEWNSNKVNRDNFEKLKSSLVNLGSFKPIIVRQLDDGRLQILGGFHRCEAAKELGFPKVPIVNLGPLDDQRAKEISLVDNTRYGQDDAELLSKILEDIDTSLMTDILPDIPLDLTDDSLGEAIEKELSEVKAKDDEHKTLHFRLEIDKAEEIEGVLADICQKHDLKHRDGYYDYPTALYLLVKGDTKSDG